MTVPQAFELALQRHEAGRLADAETLYRQILAAQPRHAEALHLLGVIAHQVGRHEVAAEWIRQSIVLNPNSPAALSNLGEACRAIGRLDEAIAAYRRALQLRPEFPEAHNNLGNALRDRGQLNEAISAWRRALELKPDYPEAYNNLGNALRDRGEIDESMAAYRRALLVKPDFPDAHYNLGNALREQGQLDEAIHSYRRALELKPGAPETLNNLGNALGRRGQLDEAIAVWVRALDFKPDYFEALNNLGNALQAQGQIDEAIVAWRRALEIKPELSQAATNLGSALRDQGELDEAIAAFRQAIQFQPESASAHSNLIFTLHLHPDHDGRTICEEHQRWNRRFSDPLKEFILPHANDPATAGRLRVGYVSPDFRDHPVGRFLLPLIERHDRDRFEILCYSGVAKPDGLTERFRALGSGGWRNTIGISDARLAQMIREDGVDILVDLAMHTEGNRLPVFARQPAPVQVAWLAYPGSSGLPGIGYRLTDARMEPPGEKPSWSSEELVRLPDCWCCYDPIGEFPEIHAPPALSGEGVTFGSLNSFAKINRDALALWARVMAAVKGSRLLMFCREGRARERIRAFFGARGIAAERVEFVNFLPWREYLSLYQRIDIALDPFPYNGMTTTCDALWMGVPVLTLPGKMPASRAALSVLSTIGLAELAASSEEDYLRLAAELAGDFPRLANLRATMRARMRASPLMDAPRFARNVEAAYRSMWERWRGAGAD